MSWFILFIAGLLGIFWAIGLKYSDGFTKFWPSVGTVLSLVASFILLGIAMKDLPVGTAYAIWVGIGAVGTAILGIMLFNESADILKIVSLGFICVGIIGLKLAHNA
ncbi:quaternary ammonium compound efflux SMR transporter SugE [Colwellia sp. D2M02]|uniref:quaternary ammonium compound efflux SMR transporter SugE n=1 Tax=Colwellia sp. D2M02 TaxID=2841562 RepID=UPI001C0A6692|nr:quaternary ammonium compound efflux SMR transporter SugE [Colwellia sp. D2M02]MBU2893838.1 quaternary ammonium compound efflux SMR transporter SugE [Colwellia sp. D2M02]